MLFNATGLYVLVVGLASVFVLILLLQKQRAGKEVTLWLFSGLAGILLGAAGAGAVTAYLGYELSRIPIPFDTADADLSEVEDTEMMGGMGGGMGGGSGGPGGGGGGGGFGGPRTIPPKALLTSMVRKLELLTGDIALNLSQEQTAAMSKILADIEAAETITDEDAQGMYDALLAVLDEDQKAKQEKIRPSRSSGGGGRGGGRGGGEESEEADEDSNPFKEAPNAEAIAALSQRLGGKKAAPPEGAEKEKAAPPEGDKKEKADP